MQHRLSRLKGDLGKGRLSLHDQCEANNQLLHESPHEESTSVDNPLIIARTFYSCQPKRLRSTWDRQPSFGPLASDQVTPAELDVSASVAVMASPRKTASRDQTIQFLTLRQAAELLGITADTLRAQIHRGRLKASKVGRDWLVDQDELERYERESRRRTSSNKTHSDDLDRRSRQDRLGRVLGRVPVDAPNFDQRRLYEPTLMARSRSSDGIASGGMSLEGAACPLASIRPTSQAGV